MVVKVRCLKGEGLLVRILEAMEEMNLRVLQARVSSQLFFFAMDAILEAHQNHFSADAITQAILKAIDQKSYEIKPTNNCKSGSRLLAPRRDATATRTVRPSAAVGSSYLAETPPLSTTRPPPPPHCQTATGHRSRPPDKMSMEENSPLYMAPSSDELAISTSETVGASEISKKRKATKSRSEVWSHFKKVTASSGVTSCKCIHCGKEYACITSWILD
nr:uncharacterized protein LOC109165865 [Ipomoea batatas]